MNEKYIVKCLNIISIQKTEGYFGEKKIDIELKSQDNESFKIELNKFGWFNNYICNDKNEPDYNLINEDVWAVLNKDEEIEFFSDTRSSLRIKQVQ